MGTFYSFSYVPTNSETNKNIRNNLNPVSIFAITKQKIPKYHILHVILIAPPDPFLKLHDRCSFNTNQFKHKTAYLIIIVP